MKNLASKIRPKNIKDIIGQTRLIKDNGLIAKMIEKNYIFSMILYANPGIGKTSLAQCIANELKIEYSIFHASYDNKSKLEEILNIAKLHDRYIIIVDEIFRLHKDKQDILLPFLENNHIFMIATTTENPFFTINPAIRSRSKLIELDPITSEEMFIGLKHIIEHHHLKIDIDDDNLKIIASYANGDIRSALNALDLLINLYSNQKITKEVLSNVLQLPIMLGSHYGDELHNIKSAFHKSLRGSDVNASLHYLARLIKLNDLDDIIRRMIACVYEDVGLSNPELLTRVSVGAESCYRLGLPEAKNILACLCIEIALSPKSNAASEAIELALSDLDNGMNYPIPKYLWDGHYASAHKLGVTGYLNPHYHPESNHEYMPTKLVGKKYYVIKEEKKK